MLRSLRAPLDHAARAKSVGAKFSFADSSLIALTELKSGYPNNYFSCTSILFIAHNVYHLVVYKHYLEDVTHLSKLLVDDLGPPPGPFHLL